MTPRLYDVCATLKADVATLYTYFTAPKAASQKSERPEQIVASSDAQDAQALEKKVYAAAHRVLGGALMLAGAVLVGVVILPIVSFKFCTTVAFAISAFIVGHDLFVMAKNRARMHSLLPATSYSTFLWTQLNSKPVDEKIYSQITRGTYWATFSAMYSKFSKVESKRTGSNSISPADELSGSDSESSGVFDSIVLSGSN